MVDARQEEMDLVEAEENGLKETPAERFKRVANHRLKVAVERLRLLRQMLDGNNARNYEWTDEQATKLVGILRDEVNQIEKRLFKREDDDHIPTI